MAEPAPAPARAEPTGMTLADLVALVAGAAVAFGIDWFSALPQLQTLGGRPAPAWYLALYWLQEGLQKGALALLPVVLARRLRYGGPLRVSEFAALAVGLPRLLHWAEGLPILGLISRSPEGHGTIAIDRYRLWHAGLLALSILAALAPAARRRRMPDWCAGLLLLVAWAGLSSSGQFLYREAVNSLPGSAGLPPSAAALLDAILKGLPFGTLLVLPIVAASLDALRPAGPPRTWVERAGLGMAAGWFLTLQVRYRFQWFYDSPRAHYLAFEAIQLASLLIEILLAAWLVRRFGPAWSRRSGVGYHGRGD